MIFKYWWNKLAYLLLAVTISGYAYAFQPAFQPPASDMVALISDVAGSVTIEAKGKSTSARLLASIPLGARVDLAEGSKLSLIYIAKGDEYKLSGAGSYQLDAASPQTISGKAPTKQTSIGGALTGKRIRSENVAQATVAMRTIRRGIESLTPSGSVTLATPLQLGWHEPTPGLSYRVQLIDSQNKVLISTEVKGNSYSLPQEIQLTGDEYYTWNLTTTTPEGELFTAGAKFRVASDATREQAIKLRAANEAAVSERVAYGLWLESENLAYDAQQVWEELSKAYPDEPNFRIRANHK